MVQLGGVCRRITKQTTVFRTGQVAGCGAATGSSSGTWPWRCFRDPVASSRRENGVGWRIRAMRRSNRAWPVLWQKRSLVHRDPRLQGMQAVYRQSKQRQGFRIVNELVGLQIGFRRRLLLSAISWATTSCSSRIMRLSACQGCGIENKQTAKVPPIQRPSDRSPRQLPRFLPKIGKTGPRLLQA